MKRYRITYTDAGDSGCPIFTTHVWAHDEDHAREQFYDPDDDGWIIVSIRKI